jgi:signal transduction histidine kinase
MHGETRPVVLLRLQERVDTRVVLHVYTWVTLVTGLTITGTGVRGVPGLLQPYASILWISGMVIAAAGCAAAGLAMNDDPVSRRRALRWFAAGHVMLGLFAWTQWAIYWRLQGVPVSIAVAPLLTGVLLLALTLPGRAFGAEEMQVATARRIRSTYNEHIQQIARREERARLARDLHDAVKQQLFVIQTAAATAQTRFDNDTEGAREALTNVRTAAREATTEMEALLDELQAAPMEHTGLVEALKRQCEALALRTGAEVSFEPGTPPPAGSLRPGAHEAVYRVAQEALANVARHARATRVAVSLHASPTRFELRVLDNGAGIDTPSRRTGMGIANMETRAAEIGGRLSISSASPGAQVLLSVPVSHPAIRGAWISAGAFALLALSAAVFYGIRGPSPDQRTSLVGLALYAAWVAWRFAAAYRIVVRKQTP